MTTLKGILFKVLSTFCFTIMSMLIRHVGSEVPLGEMVFSRSFFSLVPLAIWLASIGQLATAPRTTNPWRHVFRGLTGVGSMFFIFVGLTLLPLAEATAIGFVSPLLSVVFAAIFLRETVRGYRWTAVAIGLVGVTVMLWPRLGAADGGLDEQALGALATFAGAAFAGAAMVQIRRLTQTETTGAIVLYFLLVASFAGLTTLPFGWVVPSPLLAAELVLIGVVGGVAQILMTQSYRYADASLLAPFDYVSMIWAILFGWLAFREMPSMVVMVGAAVVIASGLLVIWREHQLGLDRRRELESAPPE